jgi:O-antigen/teichoic acid export membrane protein
VSKTDVQQPRGPFISGRSSPGLIMGARLAIIGLGLITAPIVARAIGPDGRGLTAAGLAAMTIAPVVMGAGLPMAVRRRAAMGDEAEIIRGARLYALLLIVPAVILGVFAHTYVLPGLHGVGGWLLVIGVAISPLYVSLLCDQSVLIVRRDYMRVAILQSLQPIANALGIVAGGLFGLLSVQWVIGSYVVATILAFSCSLLLVRVPIRGIRDSTIELVREGYSFAGSQVAETASNRLDQVIMVSVIGASGAGYYATAALIASLPIAVAHAIGAAIFRDAAVSPIDGRNHIVGSGLRASFTLGLISACGLAVVVPWGVPFVFGESFRGAVFPTLVGLFGTPAIVVGYVGTVSLGAVGRGRDMSLAQGVGLIVGMAALFPLGGAFGAAGASAASVVGYWIAACMAIYCLHIPCSSLLLRRSDFAASLGLVLHGRVRDRSAD